MCCSTEETCLTPRNILPELWNLLAMPATSSLLRVKHGLLLIVKHVMTGKTELMIGTTQQQLFWIDDRDSPFLRRMFQSHERSLECECHIDHLPSVATWTHCPSNCVVLLNVPAMLVLL